jgi:hypothetical protein
MSDVQEYTRTPAEAELVAAAQTELAELQAELARVDQRISDAVTEALEAEDRYREREGLG